MNIRKYGISSLNYKRFPISTADPTNHPRASPESRETNGAQVRLLSKGDRYIIPICSYSYELDEEANSRDSAEKTQSTHCTLRGSKAVRDWTKSVVCVLSTSVLSPTTPYSSTVFLLSYFSAHSLYLFTAFYERNKRVCASE